MEEHHPGRCRHGWRCLVLLGADDRRESWIIFRKEMLDSWAFWRQDDKCLFFFFLSVFRRPMRTSRRFRWEDFFSFLECQNDIEIWGSYSVQRGWRGVEVGENNRSVNNLSIDTIPSTNTNSKEEEKILFSFFHISLWWNSIVYLLLHTVGGSTHSRRRADKKKKKIQLNFAGDLEKIEKIFTFFGR
jgi:hypothetical protein